MAATVFGNLKCSKEFIMSVMARKAKKWRRPRIEAISHDAIEIPRR